MLHYRVDPKCTCGIQLTTPTRERCANIQLNLTQLFSKVDDDIFFSAAQNTLSNHPLCKFRAFMGRTHAPCISRAPFYNIDCTYHCNSKRFIRKLVVLFDVDGSFKTTYILSLFSARTKMNTDGVTLLEQTEWRHNVERKATENEGLKIKIWGFKWSVTSTSHPLIHLRIYLYVLCKHTFRMPNVLLRSLYSRVIEGRCNSLGRIN